MLVNGASVPVEAVTPWQINALLPQEIAPGSVAVTVQLADGTSLHQPATVAPTAALIELIPTFASALPQGAAFQRRNPHPR